MNDIIIRYLPYGLLFDSGYGLLKLIGYNGRLIFDNGDSVKDYKEFGYAPKFKEMSEFATTQQINKFSRDLLGKREDLIFHKLTFKKGKNDSITVKIPSIDPDYHVQITTFLKYTKNMTAEHYEWFLKNHYNIFNI